MTLVGWVLGFSTIAVLPLDIYYSRVSFADSEALHMFWRVFYWAAFFLSYLMIPLMINYETCGEFEHE